MIIKKQKEEVAAMFQGFTPETVDFLWGIRMNNNREWFLQHKKEYVSTLYEPMKALGQELFRPFLDKPGNLLKVSRIYRDARLHHPLPYKESLWICIRQDVQWWAENPCLYFEIAPEGVSYGFILYRPRVSTMQQFREELANRPEEFLKLMADTQKAVGQPVTAQLYKRPKETAIPELEPYFAWKNHIACVAEEAVGPDLFGPELGQRAGAFLEGLIPLYDYFNRFKV
ncbi:MAG: DUF2461 domain-containing protein [Oscillospiraceae bacterium]|nr:DUF2461 domain-containing protein [Oscillospiraceae bacterium]